MGRGLRDALGEIEDRRGRKGRQYPLRSVLGIAIAAMLAGANDLRAIYRRGRRLKPEALMQFDLANGRAPCHATCHHVFRSLDADALSRALGRFVTADAGPGHIVIDGKTLRGSRRLDARAIRVLAAFSTDLGAVVGDLVVEPGQNGITAALRLLQELPLAGAVITGDAIFTQREICRAIRDGDGHCLFVVKDNQPQLKAGIAEAFGDHSPLGPAPRGQWAAPDLRCAWTLEKAHGRIETRSIAVSAEVVAHPGWPGLAQVARLTRSRETHGKLGTETVYLITSLPAAEADPHRPLSLARAHWGIGNRLHHVRDVAMDEDRCRARSGARALAGWRNATLALIRRPGLPLREARENFREDRSNAIQVVTDRIL